MSNDNEYSKEEYGYDENDSQAQAKSIRGYKVVIGLLAIILVGLSVLYFNVNREQRRDYELLKIDRDSIQSNLSGLIDEYSNLKYQNDSIAANLEKANEVMEQLKKERRWNYAKIKEYEKEVGTLRSVMRNYLRQIDSLNKLNKKLSAENVSYKKEISTANLRAEVAEEKANELNNRVQQGAILRARSIRMVALNKSDKEITRVKHAATLRVDFTISANDFATPGNRPIYTRITSPDGYLLSTESVPVFTFQGESLGYSAMREVDFENEDLDVSIYYKGNGFAAGTYQIQLYASDNLIGSAEVVMK